MSDVARVPDDERYEELPLSALRLDPNNPRLPHDLDLADRTEPRLLQLMARTYNLLELARSIADKGFTPKHAEALLVVEEPPGSNEYVAVEGNRRLATLILLTNPAKRRAARTSPEWEDLAAEAKLSGHRLTSVPVIIYPNRQALKDYLGFRHITGPTQWRPEAKARFITHLLANGSTISQVARRIGSNARTVRRFAEAYAVYEQIVEHGFNYNAVESGFGIFYNALYTQGIRDYLGLPPPAGIQARPSKLVPEDRIERLGILVGLLYGDDQAKLVPVIRESRDLKELGVVLQHSIASQLLTTERDLARAYRVAGGGKSDLLALLVDSYARLLTASGQSVEFADDEDVKAQVRKLQALVEDMATRYGLASEDDRDPA